MTKQAGRGARRGSSAVALGLFAGFLALPLLGGPATARAGGPESGRAQARAAEVAEIHAGLEALDGDAFREAALALVAERPTLAARALILRAGSDDPPGVTGARFERRRDRRLEALALFEQDAAAGGPLTQELRALLSLAILADGDVDLICAATRVVSRLGFRYLTLDLAWNLRDERPVRIQEAARVALRVLYGRWFATRGEFEAVWPQLEGRGEEELFVAEFQRLAARELELLQAVLGHEPERAADVFATGPPDARAIAARELVRAVRLKQLEIPVALDRLLARLDVEVDPRAYQAALDAALELLQGQAPDAPAVDGLRARLAEVVGERGDVAATIVQALARLPWEMEAPGEAPEEDPDEDEDADADAGRTVASGLGLVARTVAGLARVDRPVDYDRLSLAIESLRGFAQRSGLPPDERRSVLAPAGEAVVDLALAGVGPLDARLDAARALDDFLDVDDLDRVLALLEPGSRAHPSLRLHLLAAVERLAPGLSPEGEVAGEIQRVLGNSLRSDDVDVRRRALEMLAGEALASHVAVRIEGEGRAGLLEVLLEGFAADPSARNQELRLELLGRLGPDAELAARLCASPGFDALIEANGRGPTVLVQALNHLVQGDVAATMATARRLARARALNGEAGPSPVGPARRKLALRLVADAGADTLGRLSLADRTTVLRWALAQQLDRLAGAPLPAKLLPHVVAWVSSPDGSELIDPERAWGHALFLGDLARRQRAPGALPIEEGGLVSFEDVRAAFAGALLVAGADGAPAPARVRLARAHFLLSTEEPADAKVAAQDFDALLAPPEEPGEPGEPGRPLAVELFPEDLRKAAQAYDAAGRPLDAARVELRLVELPAWENGAQEGHLDDLERLVQRALVLGDEDLRSAVRARVEELRRPREAEEGASDAFRRILEDPDGRARLEGFTTLLAGGLPPPSDAPPGNEEGDGREKPVGGGLNGPRQ